MNLGKLFNPFDFNGKQIIPFALITWNPIKRYTTGENFDRILVQSPDEELYLYEFNDSEDEAYNLYVLVKDEADADELNKQDDIKRSPYFGIKAGDTEEVYVG